MSKLSKSIAYLVGPIDFCINDGILWRRKVRTTLEPLGIKFIDPTDKHWDTLHEIGAEKRHVQDLKNQGKYREVKRLSNLVRQQDLRFVDISDFLVCCIDTRIHMCGSYEEIFRASAQNKPRFAFLPQGRVNAPFWIFHHFDTEHMFDTIEDMLAHIEEIAHGEVALDDKWVLIRDHI